MKKQLLLATAVVAAANLLGHSTGFAAEIGIPDSALIPSTTYFTNDLGPNIVTTGGGNGAKLVIQRDEMTMGLCSFPFHSA